MVKLKHEYERGCAVLVEHTYVFFLSLYILEFRSEDRLWAFKSNLRRELSTQLCFLYRNFSLPFIFPSMLVAIDSPERFSSRIHPRYVTIECCSIIISPLLMLSFFRILHFFLPKRMDLVLSSPK